MAPRSRRQVFENIESISSEEYGDFGPDTLHQMAYMESSYGQHPDTTDISKKYSGVFQLGLPEYGQHGDPTSTRQDTASAGGATLNMGHERIANKDDWKSYGMDKRLDELGISKELSAYMSHQQGRSGLIQLVTGLTGGERDAEGQKVSDISRYGGTISAGGTIGEIRRDKLIKNISKEKGESGDEFKSRTAGMDIKELAQNWLTQTQSKWDKGGKYVEDLRKEFGGAEEGKALPSALSHIAEKKRGLEKPSISDDEVFDSIATDELDWGESSDMEEGVSDEGFGEYFKREDEALLPKRMSAEEKKTKYDKQMSRFHKKRDIGNPEELKLRRATSEIGGGLDFVGEPVNPKGDALDNLMKVLSAPDNYKVAR